MEARKLFSPDNIRYLPLFALGMLKGLGEMAIYDLKHRRPEPSEASITIISTPERPDA